MKFKSTSIFAGILALAFVAAPIAAQACGDKDKGSESNLPEDTERSSVVDSSYSAWVAKISFRYVSRLIKRDR